MSASSHNAGQPRAGPANPSPTSDHGRQSKLHELMVAILDKLDGIDDSKFRNRRAGARYPFRRFDLPIQIVHPGGTTSSRVVATRNLSPSGVGFIVNSFLHTGTRIQLTLERRLGGVDLLKGLVVFCGHISGPYHQVGVRFESKIFPKLYVDAAVAQRLEQAGKASLLPSGGKPAAQPLKGKVLLIDDQQMEHALVTQHLKHHPDLKLTCVSDERSALKAIKADDFDVVLLDMNMETSIAETTMKVLRVVGFNGPICIVTAERSQQRLNAVMKSGAAAMLAKPYDQSKLIAMLEAQFKAPKTVIEQTALISTLPRSPETDALLAKYVASVHGMADELKAAADQKQADRVRALCQSLRGSGTSYGYAKIFETARDALKTLEANNRLEDCLTQVQQLADMCRRVAAR
jgi:DNA-binding response OmpR family regulator